MDDPVGTHPKIAARVLEDSEDAVIEHAFPGCVTGKPALLYPAQPPNSPSNPQYPVAILVENGHSVAWQPIPFGPTCETAIGQARQTPSAAEPQRTIARLDNRSN